MPAGPMLRGFRFLNWLVEIFWAFKRWVHTNSTRRIFNFLIQLGLENEVAKKQGRYQRKIMDGNYV